MIPSGWKEVKFGELFSLTSGKTKSTNLTDTKDGTNSNPVYGGNGIIGYSPEVLTNNPNIIIGRVGEYCGTVRHVNSPCWITDNALYIRELKERIDVGFLAYKLQHFDLTKLKKKGGQPLVSQEPIYSAMSSIPTNIGEQEKIAKILSTWDEAIKKLDRIIGLTEKRFQGLGHKLLFNGTNKYRLDDLCTPKQWKTISSKDLLEEGIPVFGANSWIGFYSEANHQEDCIAVTCRGATCGTVNYVKGPSYITGNSMALDSLKAEIIDRNFLYFYLRTLGLNSIISGSAQPQITGAAIGKVEVNLPSLTDQINVSSILMDATKELDCFKKMKDKILIQKLGLMQQLLTGRKRVKV